MHELGHPRMYATWQDETLNALLATLAESAHAARWETSVFTRLDIQTAVDGGSCSRRAGMGRDVCG